MNDFVIYLIESGISLALFYSVYWIFLSKDTFFVINRLYLVSSAAFSIIIPFIHITSPTFINITSLIGSRPLLESPVVFSEGSGVPAQSLGISDVLLLVYIWGVVFFFMRFVYQLLKVLMLIRKNGIHRYNGLKIVFIDKDCSPFSFFNYIFINKSNVSGDDFQRIVAHEMIHIKQYHSIDLLILEWLTIFQWFNPFVWPYKKSLKETHEYLADYAVIAQGCSAAKYQLLIFEQHVGVKLFELANNFNQSQIKRRITMMTKSKSKGLAKLKFLLMLPMLCFLILAFADSKTVREPEPADLESVHNAGPVEESSQAWTVKADQKLSDEAKKMLEQLKQIEMTIKESEKQYEQTKDNEKRRKIKEKMAVLLEKRDFLKNKLNEEHHVQIQKVQNVDAAKIEELRELYAKTDNPEKKKQIKMKIAELEQKMDAGDAKYVKIDVSPVKYDVGVDVEKDTYDAEVKLLKELYVKTDNPEKKKVIEGKLEELEKKKAMDEAKKIHVYTVMKDEVELDDLKKELEQTKDPKKKKQLEKKIAELEEMKKMEHTKQIEMTIKELRKAYEQSNDSEKRKQIKKKIAELEKQLKKK
jgi:hypothetical protein